MYKNWKQYFLMLLCVIFFVQLHAQKRKPRKATTQKREAIADTANPRTVTVTSAFKPELRAAAKINFSATAPLPDSSRQVMQYDVPAQNLFFAYKPGALQALAADIDTGFLWQNGGYIKAGFGNYTTPYFKAGVSLGDGKTNMYNINAEHISSKGSLPFQQYSKSALDATGIFKPNDKVEWTGKLFLKNTNQYQYGFQPDSLKYIKEDLQQRFTTFGARVALRNTTNNSYGISYNPDATFKLFSDNHNGKESDFVLNAPVSKTFGEKFSFNVALGVDLTHYSTDTLTITNNLYSLSPSVQYNYNGVKIIAGLISSWSQGTFAMLPNFSAEAKLNEEKFVLMGGYVGYYNKTNYASLAEFNPWLQQPTFLLNTKVKEFYGGFKGSGGSHITYAAKASFLAFNNQPLFVNDTLTGKSFVMLNESSMKAFRIHGEAGYTFQEKFSLLAGLTMTQYSVLKDNEKAWGLIPFEVNGSLRYNIFKDVLLKSDLFFFYGAEYRNKQMQSEKLNPAVDLNAGIEFKILPQLSAWLQMNNIFNNQYQRWNQYKVLGFNVLGGVVYSFGKNGK